MGDNYGDHYTVGYGQQGHNVAGISTSPVAGPDQPVLQAQVNRLNDRAERCAMLVDRLARFADRLAGTQFSAKNEAGPTGVVQGVAPQLECVLQRTEESLDKLGGLVSFLDGIA